DRQPGGRLGHLGLAVAEGDRAVDGCEVDGLGDALDLGPEGGVVDAQDGVDVLHADDVAEDDARVEGEPGELVDGALDVELQTGRGRVEGGLGVAECHRHRLGDGVGERLGESVGRLRGGQPADVHAGDRRTPRHAVAEVPGAGRVAAGEEEQDDGGDDPAAASPARLLVGEVDKGRLVGRRV